MSKRNGYFTHRDRQILRFVERYRAVQPELLASVFLPEAEDERNARRNMLRIAARLTRRGYVVEETYGLGCKYFALTGRGCKAIGLKAKSYKTFTEQSLPNALAIGWFCFRNDVTRLTPNELRGRYQELWVPGMRSSAYYTIDTTHGRQLGILVVDRGGSSRRMNRKIRRIVYQRRKVGAFRALMEARRLRISIICGLPKQQENLRRGINRDAFPWLHIDVAIVPEVADILLAGHVS